MVTVKTNIAPIVGGIGNYIDTYMEGGINYDGLLRTVATSLLGVVKHRIHEQGLAADDTKIGVYSKIPIYISLSQSPRKFATKGKNSDATISVSSSNIATRKTSTAKVGAMKNGKIRASAYFAGGYDEFKTTVGRNTLGGNVNLSLSGQLNSQLTVQATKRGYGYGWPDSEKLKRAKALEKKYGKLIWALTVSEKVLVKDVATQYVKDALSK